MIYNPAAQPVPDGVRPHKKVPHTGTDAVFAVLFLLCAILVVDWVFFGGFRFGFTLMYGILFILSVVYFAPEKSIKPFPLFCGILSLAASVPFSLYHDWFFCVLGVIGIGFLYSVFLLSFSGCVPQISGDLTMLRDSLRLIFIVPFVHLAESLQSFFAPNENGKKNLFPAVLLGLLLAIPVLAVVLPLLIRSDEAFSQLMNRMFSDISTVLLKILIGIGIAPFVITLFFALRHKLDPHASAVKIPGRARVFDAAAATAFLSALSLFYLIYLFSQLAYFFNAFSGLLPSGFNYSRYARRGFFEMAAIAAVNLVVFLLVSAFAKRRADGKISLPVRILMLFISLFTLVLIASAFSKMAFYISDLGLTRKRILTSVFMVLLVFVFLAGIVRLFAMKFQYMKFIVVTCSVVLLFTGFCDINTTIARYNTDAYMNGTIREMDMQVLADCGDASVPSLIRLLDSDDPAVRVQAGTILNTVACSRLERGYYVYGKTKNVLQLAEPLRFCDYNRTEQHSDELILQNWPRFMNCPDVAGETE